MLVQTLPQEATFDERVKRAELRILSRALAGPCPSNRRGLACDQHDGHEGPCNRNGIEWYR